MTFLLTTVAAFSLSAATCVNNRQDLLRYPLQLTLPNLEPSDLERLRMYAQRVRELELRRKWRAIGTSTGMDIATYTTHLQDILHGQGIRTTLETPEERRNVLILESVASGGNPLAQCYLDMARATEVKRLVVHLTEVDYRDRASAHDNTRGTPYFSGSQQEVGLSMDIVLYMIREDLHPYAIHEFRHAALSAKGEHSFFNHVFLRMDSSIDLLGNRVGSVPSKLGYREVLSVEEVYNFAFDAIYHLDMAMFSEPATSSSNWYNWHQFRTSIFYLGVISKGVTDLATIFLEEFQNSPVNIRAVEDKYIDLSNSYNQLLHFKIPPETANTTSNRNPNDEQDQARDVWKAEIRPSLDKMVTMASFAHEKAEHILELLDSEPDNHRAIRANTEELVFFLQDQLVSNND